MQLALSTARLEATNVVVGRGLTNSKQVSFVNDYGMLSWDVGEAVVLVLCAVRCMLHACAFLSSCSGVLVLVVRRFCFHCRASVVKV